MEKLTYKEAESKIFDAYFKDEIIPTNPVFCFCGTLAPFTRRHYLWSSYATHRMYPEKFYYSYKEYGDMEMALFTGFDSDVTYYNTGAVECTTRYCLEDVENYEEKLFQGMCNALEVLKQIHIERGESIEDNIPLWKREKALA